MNFIFPFILGCCHHPNWRTHIFQRGGPGSPTSKCWNFHLWSGDLPAMELLANYRPVVDYCLCTSDEDPSIYSGDAAASPILFLPRTGETPAKFILSFGARIGQRKSRHISFQLPSNFGFHVNFWVEKPSSRFSAGSPNFCRISRAIFVRLGWWWEPWEPVAKLVELTWIILLGLFPSRLPGGIDRICRHCVTARGSLWPAEWIKTWITFWVYGGYNYTVSGMPMN